MIAEIYELIVSDSVIDMVHNVGYSIVELYIPNKKIAFNEANDSFHCFITKKDRYKDAVKVGIIEVPKAISLAMTDYINISKRLDETKKWYRQCVLSGNYKKVKNRKKKLSTTHD